MLHRREMALQLGDEIVIRAARENLRNVGSTRPKHLDRKLQSRFHQSHRPEVIGLRMADRIRGHVRHDEVRRAVQGIAKPFRRIIVHEIHLQDFDAVDRVGREQVDSDDFGGWRAATDDLAPPAWSNAEIDHGLDALEQAEALVELEQFISGAASVILRLGSADIGVVELPLEPTGR